MVLEEYLAGISFLLSPQPSMLVYLIPVLMVEFVMKFRQASSVTARRGGVDQRVLLVGMLLLVTDLLGWKG